MPSSSRVAIVTGGNSGIGKGLTISLINQRWNVAVADINEDTHFAKELGERASFYRCDVADYDR
jgi:NAD(P)-dependent dehydrogenase (short-subunit alcohol dehydrogenase family)